jgi:hypothetical protein
VVGVPINLDSLSTEMDVYDDIAAPSLLTGRDTLAVASWGDRDPHAVTSTRTATPCQAAGKRPDNQGQR